MPLRQLLVLLVYLCQPTDNGLLYLEYVLVYLAELSLNTLPLQEELLMVGRGCAFGVRALCRMLVDFGEWEELAAVAALYIDHLSKCLLFGVRIAILITTII